VKIFTGNESSWSEKVNFVDDNDVFVGYDMGQCCCEYAGWYIAESVTPYDYNSDLSSATPPDVESYVFDKDYFEHVAEGDLDSGGMVVFKLIADNKPDLFLHIFNSHNGYYGHGFQVKHSGVIVKDDVL